MNFVIYFSNTSLCLLMMLNEDRLIISNKKNHGTIHLSKAYFYTFLFFFYKIKKYAIFKKK